MRDLVSPVFQPILDLKSKQFGWLEALVRINDDSTKQGHIQLLMLGEACGFIHHIDRAVLLNVLDSQPAAGLPISVNLSAVTIERQESGILEALGRHPDIARHVILEITETVQIRNVSIVHSFCDNARQLGCRIAIDDFGTGFFTPELVLDLHPDLIKLSQSLVNEITRTRDLSYLDDIRWVAATVRADMVAEGIDSVDKLNMLGAIGCRYAQGFMIAKPMSLSELWRHHLYPPTAVPLPFQVAVA